MIAMQSIDSCFHSCTSYRYCKSPTSCQSIDAAEEVSFSDFAIEYVKLADENDIWNGRETGWSNYDIHITNMID